MATPKEEMSEIVQRLRQQIDALTQEQAEALKRATYLGMTPDEVEDLRRTSHQNHGTDGATG